MGVPSYFCDKRNGMTTELIVAILGLVTAVIGLVAAWISKRQEKVHRYEFGSTPEKRPSPTSIVLACGLGGLLLAMLGLFLFQWSLFKETGDWGNFLGGYITFGLAGLICGIAIGKWITSGK
jgi:hypothetical protein